MPRAATSVAMSTRTSPLRRERTLALRLGLVAVDSDRRDTAVIQMANDAIYAMLGSGEDEHPTKGRIAQETGQQAALSVT